MSLRLPEPECAEKFCIRFADVVLIGGGIIAAVELVLGATLLAIAWLATREPDAPRRILVAVGVRAGGALAGCPALRDLGVPELATLAGRDATLDGKGVVVCNHVPRKVCSDLALRAVCFSALSPSSRTARC